MCVARLCLRTGVYVYVCVSMQGDSIGTSSTPIHNPCMRPTAASLGLMSTSNEEETTLDDNPSGELDLTGINDDEIDKVRASCYNCL